MKKDKYIINDIFRNKKYLAAILAFAIFVVSGIGNNISYAKGNDIITRIDMEQLVNTFTSSEYANNDHLKEVANDILEIAKLRTEMDFNDFVSILTKKESYIKYVNQTKKNSNELEGYTLSVSEKDQLERVDRLAANYYSSYQKDGEFPSEQTGRASLSMVGTATTAEAVLIFEEMGIVVSEARLALTLARAGIAVGLSSALPAVILLALAAGVVVVGIYAWNLIQYQAALEQQLRVDMQQIVVRATESISMTSSLYWQMNTNNQVHFAAERNNYKPGGVKVFSPISESTAKGRMLLSQDTFNASYSHASIAGAPIGYTSKHEAAHTNNGYVANLPHFHAYVGTIKWLNGHAFYR